jgi:hypothetical protein
MNNFVNKSRLQNAICNGAVYYEKIEELFWLENNSITFD